MMDREARSEHAPLITRAWEELRREERGPAEAFAESLAIGVAEIVRAGVPDVALGPLIAGVDALVGGVILALCAAERDLAQREARQARWADALADGSGARDVRFRRCRDRLRQELGAALEQSAHTLHAVAAHHGVPLVQVHVVAAGRNGRLVVRVIASPGGRPGADARVAEQEAPQAQEPEGLAVGAERTYLVLGVVHALQVLASDAQRQHRIVDLSVGGDAALYATWHGAWAVTATAAATAARLLAVARRAGVAEGESARARPARPDAGPTPQTDASPAHAPAVDTPAHVQQVVGQVLRAVQPRTPRALRAAVERAVQLRVAQAIDALRGAARRTDEASAAARGAVGGGGDRSAPPRMMAAVGPTATQGTIDPGLLQEATALLDEAWESVLGAPIARDAVVRLLTPAPTSAGDAADGATDRATPAPLLALELVDCSEPGLWPEAALHSATPPVAAAPVLYVRPEGPCDGASWIARYVTPHLTRRGTGPSGAPSRAVGGPAARGRRGAS